MPPRKERTIARIPATSSSPAVSVLRPPRESDMPSFGTMRPLVEAKARPLIGPNHPNPMPEAKPVDRVSLNLVDSGVDHKATVLFEIVRMLQPDSEHLPFHADHKGIFMGSKKVGSVIGSASDSPSMLVWMDWLFSISGSRPPNHRLLEVLPIPVLVNKFSIGEVSSFVSRLASTKYTAITADKFLLYIKLFDSKSGPELESFRVKWPGSS